MQDFGRALKKGLLESGDSIKVAAKESEAIFSPINAARQEVHRTIPKIAKDAAKFIDDVDINTLLRKKAILRRSLSAAERSGKIPTERASVIGEVVNNIDSLIKSKVPGIEIANTNYALFVRTREMMINQFEAIFGSSKLKGAPTFLGTGKGEKFLRNIANFTEEDIGLLRKFENATNINIIKPAQQADIARRLGNLVKKLAGISVVLGALKAAGADRLFIQSLDVSN